MCKTEDEVLAKVFYMLGTPNPRVNKPHMFKHCWTKIKQKKDPFEIKKIDDHGEIEQYFYDLKTSSNHFHVGPGELVVHNTDEEK